MFSSVEEVDWDRWIFTEDAVLNFIQKDDKVLLIHKKRGLGKGKVNAPGGRIDPGESAKDAAIRECVEEVGLEPSNLVQVGELNFIFTNGYSLRGLVYFSSHFTGEMVETEEANPFWCSISEIPFEKMWADDIEWLPMVLKGKTFIGQFIFDDDRMLSLDVKETGRWSFN